MSIDSPKMQEAIAEHSICHPGRPNIEKNKTIITLNFDFDLIFLICKSESIDNACAFDPLQWGVELRTMIVILNFEFLVFQNDLVAISDLFILIRI